MFDVHQTAAAALSILIEGDDFRYGAANAACIAMSGLAARAATGLTPHECFPSAVADLVVERYRACRDTRQAMGYMTAVGPLLGQMSYWTTLMPIVDGSGTVTSLVAILFPETAVALPEHSPEGLNAKMSRAMEGMDVGFWVYEIATGAFETSRSLAEMLAGPGHVTLGLLQYGGYITCESFTPEELLTPAAVRPQVEYQVATYDGRTRWLQSKRRTIVDDHGRPVRVVSLVVDITDQKTAIETLENEASTDALTSLKNRRAFDKLAAWTFTEAQTRRAPVGLLLFDLDGFKPINDRHGHRAGDEILRRVARRIARCVAPGDTLARIGGDEFAVLLRDDPAVSGNTLATKVARAFKRPFLLGHAPVFVGVSTGLAVSTPADLAIGVLFERADQQLYTMKRERRLLTA